jgi:4-amino-4-deoxy-L-arabinose transferase-like glycosyltransferase
MKPRHLLLILILAYASFLRLYHFSSLPPGLDHDEAMNGANVLEILETHQLKVFYPENNGREGLYIAILVPFVAVLGNKAWVLRLPAAGFGILTVWGTYLLAAELFSAPVGLLSAFFLATSFWHMNFSRIGFRAIASPCLLTFGLYLFLSGMARSRAGRVAILRMVFGGVLYGLGFHTYIPYRGTPLLFAALFAYYYRQARNEHWLPAYWRALAAFAVPAGAVVLPLAIYFLRYPGQFFGRAVAVSILNSRHPLIVSMADSAWKTVLMFFLKGDINWRHNVSGRPELFLPTALFFAGGLAVAMYGIIRRREFGFMATAGLLATAFLPAIFSAEGMPHSLRSILLIVPALILAGTAAWRTWTWTTAHLPVSVASTAAILLLAGLCYEPWHTYFDVWARDPHLNTAFCTPCSNVAEEIKDLPREAQKYVVVASPGVSVHGIPVDATPVMFLTRSYTKKEQEETKIHYIPPPPGRFNSAAFCFQAMASLPGQSVFCIP